MGSSLTTDIKPHELIAFKKLPSETLLEDIEIPERPENRKPTDQRFLIIFCVVVILLIPFLIYALIYANTGRFIDQINDFRWIEKYEKWNCSEKDLTNKPFSKISADSQRCIPVDKPVYIPVDIKDILSYISQEKRKIGLSCLIPLGTVLCIMCLLRYATQVMVWISITATLITYTAFIGFCWFNFVLASMMGSHTPTDFLCFCTLITMGLLALICIIISVRNKIQVFMVLLKEAMIAVFGMPQLLLVPALAFAAIVIILALSATAFVYMTTSSVLDEDKDGRLIYQQNIAMYFTQAFNLVVTIWTVQFVLGMQYMVISGAVANRYFAKKKKNLDSPLLVSAYVTFRFHLGTIAYGSLVISLVSAVRGLVSAIISNFRMTTLRTTARSCFGTIETILIVLSNDAYIITAMHGKPLYKSGKRAAGIMFENAMNVLSIKFISSFIFFTVHLNIVILIWVLMFHDELLYFEYLTVPIIVGVISFTISTTFLALCESAVHTTFLCLCEDRLLNDGMDRPYAMTTKLMEFVNRARIIFREWR